MPLAYQSKVKHISASSENSNSCCNKIAFEFIDYVFVTFAYKRVFEEGQIILSLLFSLYMPIEYDTCNEFKYIFRGILPFRKTYYLGVYIYFIKKLEKYISKIILE